MNYAIGRRSRKEKIVLISLSVFVPLFFCLCLFLGVSQLPFREAFLALMGRGEATATRILWQIRMPRVLAALLSGAGLSVSGLMMQTVLNNPMASPSTLGVSNAAVFGANLSIIGLAGGFLSSGHNLQNLTTDINLYATSVTAFLFSVLSVCLILGLCRLRSFSPNTVVLAGIAVGSIWTAATTILQFFATDVGLSAAVVWSFGDLGRATYESDGILFVVIAVSLLLFRLFAHAYNALLSSETTAAAMGVPVRVLRFCTLLLASIVTAVCVSFLGIIGFVGIICPHVVKRLLGQNHRVTIPASALCGSLLLLFSDLLSRTLGGGAALPVGAITSLLGAPFFVAILLGRKEREAC